jgi:hypothetical protein
MEESNGRRSICIKDDHTWDIVPKSKDVKSISCQWVDKVKTF